MMYGGLQATLHNAWLRGKDQKPFKAADFVDGPAKPIAQGSEEKKFMLRAVLSAGFSKKKRKPRGK